MNDRTVRSMGIAGALGGGLVLLSAIPPQWYGVPRTDSYLFFPPPGSPLWINREAVPVLAVLGVLGLFVALLGLVRRDWAAAGRLRRWSGVFALVGLGGVAVATPILEYVSFGDTGATTLVVLGGVLFAVLSAVVLAPALLALGFGYARTRRPRVGYALVGVVLGVPALGYLVPEPAGTLGAAVPVAVAAAVVGRDLYVHPDPLPVADDGTDATERAERT